MEAFVDKHLFAEAAVERGLINHDESESDSQLRSAARKLLKNFEKGKR